VGGINEKIEGWFRVCEAVGLDGQQGVLIPERNRRHLMLDDAVVQAVAQGRFKVHTAAVAADALAVLTGLDSDLPIPPPQAAPYPPGTLLGRAEQALLAYRRAWQRAGGTGRSRRLRP
jgi:hypothetical protein